jgi:hypothetical protein
VSHARFQSNKNGVAFTFTHSLAHTHACLFSLMAKQWCVDYGVVSNEVAQKMLKDILKQKQGGSSSAAAPSRAAPSSSSSSSKKRQGSKGRSADDIEGDTGMGKSGGWDGAGSMGL